MIKLTVQPADGTCNFCRSHEVAEVKLQSSDNLRNMVVYLCRDCAYDLQQDLNNYVGAIEFKRGDSR